MVRARPSRCSYAPLVTDPSATVTDLLQHLIRNACVNDGGADTGHEERSVDTLSAFLGTSGLECETYEPEPGRKSLVARIEGTDPNAPSLLLMGHTDVVPVNEANWRHDPFGGELIDGEVWGRGAVDMLNLTSSMAVAMRRLADSGFRPKGTLTYLAVADEEALGTHGAKYLVDHERDVIGADYVITESGGIPIPSTDGIRLPIMVGEKGCYWCKIIVRGTAGHGSQPWRTDNALVKAAEVVRRIATYQPETDINEIWRRFLEGMGLPEEMTSPLLSADTFMDAIEALPIGMGRQFHACTHTTFSPNIVHGGSKINTIPDTVELEVDIRTLPGQTAEDVEGQLRSALGDLADEVTFEASAYDASSSSPIDTPLWDTLSRTSKQFYADSQTVPMLIVGATDARFFRSFGATAYGFGLFSRNLAFEDFSKMFHGDDERVDVESLRLSTELWEAVARDLLG